MKKNVILIGAIAIIAGISVFIYSCKKDLSTTGGNTTLTSTQLNSLVEKDANIIAISDLMNANIKIHLQNAMEQVRNHIPFKKFNSEQLSQHKELKSIPEIQDAFKANGIVNRSLELSTNISSIGTNLNAFVANHPEVKSMSKADLTNAFYQAFKKHGIKIKKGAVKVFKKVQEDNEHCYTDCSEAMDAEDNNHYYADAAIDAAAVIAIGGCTLLTEGDIEDCINLASLAATAADEIEDSRYYSALGLITANLNTCLAGYSSFHARFTQPLEFKL